MYTFKMDDDRSYNQVIYNNCFPVNIDAVFLCSEDRASFISLCASVGITPSALIEAFINDLICGKYSHGSDEHTYANEWFERCNFDSENDCSTFLKFLLHSLHDVESVFTLLSDYEKITFLERELALDLFDSPEALKNALNKLKSNTDLYNYYDAYIEYNPYCKPLDVEMRIISRFKNDTESF